MKYPVGIHSFEEIRKGGYAYVDKTAQMHDLISHFKFSLLTRPPGFGKSLLLSAMKAYFEGKKELFKGLAIERLEQEWTRREVLFMDLGACTYREVNDLEKKFSDIFCQWEKTYGPFKTGSTLESRFLRIIQHAYEKTGHKVAILVDNYDAPMLSAIRDEPLRKKLWKRIMSIFSVFKSCDHYIRHALMTGVTGFGELDFLLGDLNNVIDVSFYDRHADICGITQKELHDCFEDSVRELARANSMTCQQACARLEETCFGYRFCGDSEAMFDPSGLLKAFEKKRFGNFRPPTGMLPFLAGISAKDKFDIEKALDSIPEELLKRFSPSKYFPITMLYQFGYLTIKGYDDEYDYYRLGFQNREAEEEFKRYNATVSNMDNQKNN